MKKELDSSPLTKSQRKRLIHAAELAAHQAYAPYSRFRVGAAVLAASGKIYPGANIENASYGLGTCAERVALAAAKVAGEKQLIAIAIACIDAAPDAPLEQRLPCGACLQWLQELAPDATIFILGEQNSFRLQDLLPHAFTLAP
jgi:cytidine deaminase